MQYCLWVHFLRKFAEECSFEEATSEGRGGNGSKKEMRQDGRKCAMDVRCHASATCCQDHLVPNSVCLS